MTLCSSGPARDCRSSWAFRASIYNGVYSANEFLTRINLMHAYEFPKYDEPMVDFRGKNVAVIGGGNTPLSTPFGQHCGWAGKAYVLYRRSEAEMPARKEEVKHAKEEGIEFHVLTAPLGIPSGRKRVADGRPLSENGTGRTRFFRKTPPRSH
jgi:NADPH-dependent glutamate synthase beta subunit-like oxidoreductase